MLEGKSKQDRALCTSKSARKKRVKRPEQVMFRVEVCCNMQDWREQRQPATELDCLRERILKQKGLVIGYYK